MTVSNMDANGSFQFLLDSMTEWQTAASTLLTHVAQSHEDYKAEYSRLVHRVEKRKRPDSARSIRSRDVEDHSANVTTASPESVSSLGTEEGRELSPLDARAQFLHMHAQRERRKPATSVRSIFSGPKKSYTKAKVVIHYDRHIQLELEKLVRTLGVGRNNLRKGRNAYVASQGFKLPTLGRYQSPENDYTVSRTTKLSDKGRATIGVPDSDWVGESSFTLMDKSLAEAQALCETAAHQIIREGDCQAELKDLQDILVTMQTRTTAALAGLKKEQESRALANRVAELTGTDLPHKSPKNPGSPPRVNRAMKYIKLSSPLPTDNSCTGPIPTLSPQSTTLDIIEVDSMIGSGTSSATLSLDLTNIRSAARAASQA